MSNIAVIGDLESILGFKALGFNVHTASNPETAREILHQLAREDTAIIYMTEQLAQSIPNDIRKYQERITLAIILIPGAAGNLGIGLKQIRTLMEKAVGMDILQEREEVAP